MKRSPLRARPPVDQSAEPGYAAWKAPAWGRCEACGKRDRLIRHHVVLAQHVRALGGPVYDLRNSLLLGTGVRCDCHRSHHHATRRLPLAVVSPEAIAFAQELLGGERAGEYLRRYYR